MNYESISAEKGTLAGFERYTFHDSYVEKITMDYEGQKVIVCLKNPFFKYYGSFTCEECLYFSASSACVWQDFLQDYDLRIAEMYVEPDALIDTLLRDTLKGLPEKEGKTFYNNTTPEHFCLAFLTTCGDKIRMIGKRIRWERLGDWPIETEKES